MDIEGLVLSKTQVKESDLIVNLLLRNGKQQAIYVYGGAGGGKKNKGSIYELGFLIAGTVNENKRYQQSTVILREGHIKWKHDKIRLNFEAFYLLIFILELSKKISMEESPDYVDQYEEELFSITGNAIFHLDSTDSTHMKKILLIFLQRVTNYLGVLPNLDSCVVCGELMEKNDNIGMVLEQGGFVHSSCQSSGKNSAELRHLLIGAGKHKFNEYHLLPNIHGENLIQLFDYLCYQLDFNNTQFKSWNFLNGFFASSTTK